MLFLIKPFLLSQDWSGKGRQIGYVYDENGSPLEGVTVKLLLVRTQSGLEVETDKDGKWIAMGVRGGMWHVDFQKIGYEPRKISVRISEFNKRNEPIEIQLKKIEGFAITDELKDDFKKGNDLYNQKKYTEAIALFQSILEQFPSAYIINFSIGNSYFQMENYEEAEMYYQKVLENDPDYTHALIGVGNCHMNRGNTEEAIQWYGKIDFANIDDPIVLYNVGTVFYNNSQYEEALKYYKRSVEIQKDFLDSRYQLGLVYLALGNNAEAIAEFEAYLTYDADSPKAAQVKGFLEYLKK
jgi:tetratricopeptide (TPR) repeat protein